VGQERTPQDERGPVEFEMKLPRTVSGRRVKRFIKKRQSSTRSEELPVDAAPDPEPSHHVVQNGLTLYRNPWDSALPPSWAELLVWPLEWAKGALAHHPEARPLKVLKPTWEDASSSKASSSCIRATWLGHASAYACLPAAKPGDEIRLLFDPIFSARAGPTQYTGVPRFRAVPCPVSDLPGVDIVCISHNHYDHLDETSLRDLNRCFPNALFCVPKGARAVL
jgi:N-acyl-phosphatidylethanolamine-hydrolysing phospholipase D